ncbi:MAG: HEAT repeat domain-containing protein [Anaerolineae bacterium]|nr:HEAT repeat domain-containing protein [Anaerolineae bacterium]
MAKITRPIPIRVFIDALLDESTPFPPAYLRRFSDLEGSELRAVVAAWPKVNTTRRIALMEDLDELNDTDMLVLFDQFASSVLDDPEPAVRVSALGIIWETGSKKLIGKLMDMLVNDPASQVRAAAASNLGRFVYEGELEELDQETLHNIEAALLNVIHGDDDPLVRRRALEAMGFSSRPEMEALIEQAYRREEPEWIASALFAMGRSYNARWEPQVKRMLNHPKSNVQLEAVRAAGELALDSSRRALMDILEEEAADPEIRYAAIWSLSQIGGEQVRETLEKLADETEDEEEAEILENAIDNLLLTETGQELNLFDIDLEDESLVDDTPDASAEEDEDLDDLDEEEDDSAESR